MVKVLFIEDKPTDALLVQTFLRGSRNEKFNVVLASTLFTGFSLLQRKDFNVVLLSLELREIKNVQEVLGILKAIKDVPVIVCTSSRDENLKLTALNSGAYGIVFKNQIQVRLLIDQIKFVVESFKRSSRDYQMFSRNIL